MNVEHRSKAIASIGVYKSSEAIGRAFADEIIASDQFLELSLDVENFASGKIKLDEW